MAQSPRSRESRERRDVPAHSGRAMSVWDAFIYNFLAMGVIFPWTYLWGPASFPGADIGIAIALTLIAQTPISIAYSYLAAVLPRNGGDYLFQKFAFGKMGFVIVMSGFIIWILQWIALSGWLFSVLGLAPLLMFFGVQYNLPILTSWSISVQSSGGIFIISVLLSLFTAFFLTFGLRIFALVQRWLFLFTIAAIVAVIWIFFQNHGMSSIERLNSFVKIVIEQLNLQTNIDLQQDFVHFVVSDVEKSGFNTSPPFSLWATLGVVPIAWTSLQWATYSVEQNGEIAQSGSFKWQLCITLGSASLVTLFLVLVAYLEHRAMSGQFVNAVSAAYWQLDASPDTRFFLKTVLQPFPNVLAMASSGNAALATIIALGFIANAFQVTCNCYIGVTRILAAMGEDGMFPMLEGRFALDQYDPKTGTPVVAHWVYFAASIFWIALYDFVPDWSAYSLGVTFACGYVFALSALAAVRISSREGLQSAWQASQVARTSPVWFKVWGYSGFVMGAAMVLAYLLVPNLGITGNVPYVIVLLIFVSSYALLVYADYKSDRASTR